MAEPCKKTGLVDDKNKAGVGFSKKFEELVKKISGNKYAHVRKRHVCIFIAHVTIDCLTS